MGIKIFKTRSFATLGDMLEWLDAEGERILVTNVAGTSSLVVTFAEATMSHWRVTKRPSIDEIDMSSAQLAD